MPMTPDALRAALRKIGDAESGPHFMGKPDRWYDVPHWRCSKDHVSAHYIKTDAGDTCPACGSFVYLTFPEDRDGPLKGNFMTAARTPRDSLIFPLDVSTEEDAAGWMQLLEQHVGVFKIGLELFTAVGPHGVRLATNTFGARVFLDLKLHDIPATMEGAVRSALDLGVDYLTVHASAGPKALEACARAVEGTDLRLLAVTALTSLGEDDLIEIGFCPELVHGVAGRSLVRQMARMAHGAGIRGFVCSPKEASELRGLVGLDSVIVTPGIRPAGSDVGDQKRVDTPASAIQAGADMLVVGRPIRNAPNPQEAAQAILREIEEARRG